MIEVQKINRYIVKVFGIEHDLSEKEYQKFYDDSMNIPAPQDMIIGIDWGTGSSSTVYIPFEEYQRANIGKVTNVLLNQEAPNETNKEEVNVRSESGLEAVEETIKKENENEPKPESTDGIQKLGNTKNILWTPEMLQPYVEMVIAGKTYSEVRQSLIDNCGLTKSNANSLYYGRIKPMVPEPIKEPVTDMSAKEEPDFKPKPIKTVSPVEVSIFKAETVNKKTAPVMQPVSKPISTKMKTVSEIAKEHHVTKDIVIEIAQMPHYDSVITFKDEICTRETMRSSYQIKDLKEIYRDTHIGIRW